MSTILLLTNGIVPALMGVSTEREIGLTAALVVFIMLTLLQTAYIVLLFVMPRFRQFFFREDKPAEQKVEPDKDAKPAQKETKKKAADKKPAASKKEPKPAEAAHRLVYTDSVPTVPLGGVSTPTTGDDEDLLRRTNDAYISMTMSGTPEKKKSSGAGGEALESVPTVRLPEANADAPQKAEKPAPRRTVPPTTPLRTGERTSYTPRTGERTTAAAPAAKPAAAPAAKSKPSAKK